MPINTTRTAQYAAVAAKTSCRLAVVARESAIEKARAKIKVTEAIFIVDMFWLRNKYMGISSKVVEATAMMTLIRTPSREAE